MYLSHEESSTTLARLHTAHFSPFITFNHLETDCEFGIRRSPPNPQYSVIIPKALNIVTILSLEPKRAMP
ncbi:predicted protein [Histoplasma capsulatum H143]|uniref:Uncharacterized protein n=1 Tax=Ajellomyces capsulatus (strain H143) TaxID=544712 RepID=C6HHE4_AJECH|nr:predicted protein [Histoplasma capsulatum H143]